MNLSKDEKQLIEEGMVLYTDKLIPSRVTTDGETDYKYSADVYVTINGIFENKGTLHLRIFDQASNDIDPSLIYGGKKISEIRLDFEQGGDDYDERFSYLQDSEAKVIYIDGEEKEIMIPSELDGLSLLYAAKIFFIDIIKVLLMSDNYYSYN